MNIFVSMCKNNIDDLDPCRERESKQSVIVDMLKDFLLCSMLAFCRIKSGIFHNILMYLSLRINFWFDTT